MTPQPVSRNPIEAKRTSSALWLSKPG